MGSVFTHPGLRMSAHLLPSAQPIKISSTMKRVVVSVKYSSVPAEYHDGVFKIPILVKNSGMKIPAAPNIAHLQCTSSACTFHLNVSGSEPRPRGSKPKSPGRLPSSHGGGVLPGNQRGLSGSAAAHTGNVGPAAGFVYFLTDLSFFPERKEAFVVPTTDPVFWELGDEMATAAIAEEAQNLTQNGLCLAPSPASMEESESASDKPRPWQSYHTVYTNAKAGMDGVDQEKVQKVVYEMSKGSKYFENEERKEAFNRQKIEHMRARADKLSAADLSHYQKDADKRILELESTRDLSRIWLHVDMDAFYAAVETLSNPSLKGKPMAVGSMSMISTANYEARKFGVRAAMPGFIALKLCPDLIFVPTDFKKYTYYSDLTRKVFWDYDPNFMAASLDEAYLDITKVCEERSITGAEIAEELRSRVYEETGLTCSAGVAPNRLLAKVCSDINKPNGQFVLPNDRMAVMTFISSLPIRKIGGIGKVTENILKGVFGVSTCEEMLQKGSFLCALFSHSSADFFLSVGLGLGGTDTPEVRFRKSISSERTFSATEDAALLYQELANIAEMLSADMQKEGLSGRTLTLKLKTASFEVRTRAVTLQKYISSSDDILKHASNLLKAELPISLRLIGLRVSHFNEDKGGVPGDPKQKTLTTFLISGDASRRTGDDQRFLGSDLSDLHFISEKETAISLDDNETCHHEFGDPFERKHLSDIDDKNCISSINACEMEKIDELSRNKTAAMVNTADVKEWTTKSPKRDLSRVSEDDSSVQREPEDSNPDRLNKEPSTSGNEEFFSSNQMEMLFWVDDYKCSLCGAELPSSFVEERQEHSDFHLAERIQKEESGTGSSSLIPRLRIVPMDYSGSQNRRKKHKSSPKQGMHLPIDSFFTKKGSRQL